MDLSDGHHLLRVLGFEVVWVETGRLQPRSIRTVDVP